MDNDHLTDRPDNDIDGHRCGVCEKVFTRSSNLARHVRVLHSEGDSRPFKCKLCDFKTPFRCNLLNHVKKHDKPPDASKLKKLCVMCGHPAETAASVEKHYEDVHNVNMEVEKVAFSTKEDFYEWKSKLENSEKCQFAVRGTNKTKAHTTVLFRCFRSGVFKSKSKNAGLRRSMKAQGSNKINGHCPAKLDVIFQPGGVVSVVYVKTHLGHSNDLVRLRLSKSERDEIAKQISMNIPFDDILKAVRESSEAKDVERLKLLSRKDLHNIARDYKLKGEARAVKPPPHLHNVVTDLQKSDLVAFYKPEGVSSVKFPHLLNNDFVLILMNEAQTNNLKKFGNNFVCVDSYRKEHSHGFRLTTLLVHDELNSALPCAFMFSYRIDAAISEIFFRIIRDKVGVTLQPQVFISDFPEFLRGGWVKFNDPPMNTWFCSWHVERALRKNLRKICEKEREKRDAAFQSVMELVDTTDVKVFASKLYKTLDSFLNDPKTNEFGKYFESEFLPSARSWASCYRDSNCSSYVENFHSTLKQIDEHGTRPRRLDLAIENLVKYVDDSYRINRGKRPSAAVIKQRHKSSLKLCIENVISEDGVWKMYSLGRKDLYEIRRSDKQCDCSLRCEECGICVHAYTCTCGDALKSLMCQHVHFIHKFYSDVFSCEEIDCLEVNSVPEELTEALTTPDRALHHEEDTVHLSIVEPTLPSSSVQSPSSGVNRKRFREEELWGLFVELMNSAKTSDDLQVIGASLESARATLRAADVTENQPGKKLHIGEVAIDAQEELLLVLHN